MEHDAGHAPGGDHHAVGHRVRQPGVRRHVVARGELRALIPGYDCCSFRGKMAALDLNTGAIVWQIVMAPAGFPGNAVWGSSPAIDPKRGQLYIATGNNYDAPPETLACIAAAGDDPEAQQACLPADNHFDSIMALDLKTGAIRWVTRALGFDAWTVDCIPFIGDGTNCPEPAGPDFDFGQAPALFTVTGWAAANRDVVGAGQKSGQYWALDPDTGRGPLGHPGRPRRDGRRPAVGLGRRRPAHLHRQRQQQRRAVDAAGRHDRRRTACGAVSTPSPASCCGRRCRRSAASPSAAASSGPLTTANGVVFGCALDSAGPHVRARRSHRSDPVDASPVAARACPARRSPRAGCSGARATRFFGTPNNKLYSFGLPG